jgi:hypothetical protein
MHRRLLAVLAAGAMLLGACGGDDEGNAGTGDDEYVEAMAASMQDDEELPFAEEDIDCLAGEFVDALGGAERLEADGIAPEDLRSGQAMEDLDLELGQEEADGIAASFGNCDVSLAQLLLAEAGDQVPEEVRTCVEENLDEDVLADFFATVLIDEQSGEEPPEELLEPLLACF